MVKLTELKSCASLLHILWYPTYISLFSHVVLKAVAESCSHAADGSSLNSQEEESTTCRIFPQRCSSCFSACQDSLAAYYKDSPANIHFSQSLPCLVIKLEVWECSMCKRATTVTCFKADAGRLWGSFCIMPFNYDGRCWRIFVRQTCLNTQIVVPLGGKILTRQ